MLSLKFPEIERAYGSHSFFFKKYWPIIFREELFQFGSNRSNLNKTCRKSNSMLATALQFAVYPLKLMRNNEWKYLCMKLVLNILFYFK